MLQIFITIIFLHLLDYFFSDVYSIDTYSTSPPVMSTAVSRAVPVSLVSSRTTRQVI